MSHNITHNMSHNMNHNKNGNKNLFYSIHNMSHNMNHNKNGNKNQWLYRIDNGASSENSSLKITITAVFTK